MMRLIRASFLLILLVGGVAQAQESIDFGDRVEAVLSTVGLETYQFSGEQGQFVTITLESDVFDSFLRLLDPDDNQIAEDDDSAGNLNSRIGPFRLPTNGLYTIVATSLNGRDVGDYSLTLGSATVRRMEYTQEMTADLTDAEPTVDYMFTAQAGDTISIDLMSDDFDTYLTLFSTSPSAELTTNDDGGAGLNSRIGPYTLTETGDYVIRVSALGEADGAYTLALNRIKLVSLAFDQISKGEIVGSRSLYFAFEGQADQVIDIRVDSGDTLDTYLTLIGPDSYEVASDDDSGGRIDPLLAGVPLRQDGRHYIIVQPNISRDAVTALTVSLTESRLASLDDGQQTIQFGDLSNDQFLTFSGTANEIAYLFIEVAVDTPISPTITIMQGGDQVANLSTFSIIDKLSFGFLIPQDGPVIVQFIDYSYEAAELTVTLER